MKNKVVIPFDGTKEQEEQLRSVLAELKSVPGGLMPALQKAQDIYGYLPKEVQIIIAEELGMPLSEVYGVATFYSQFSLTPKGRYQIGVCLGTACYVKGSGEIYNELVKLLGIESGGVTADKRFSLDATRCIGCCGLAPVMTINGEVYGKITAKDVAGILATYKA
ncbi:MAG TPA: NAD(P)H-dependent oxidoreductase subunit E [Clostridiales bacterium]|nr:NAD(P)H-dependent oxidoreductase subunit E [Clostridiales bacterium]